MKYMKSSQATEEELRSEILELSGGLIDLTEITVLKKRELWKLYKEMAEVIEEDSKTDDNEKVSDENQMQPIDTVPEYGEKGWSDYMISLLQDDEIAITANGEKVPKASGLRRIVEPMLGTIVKSGPTQVLSSLESSAPGKAVVCYEIVIDWMNSGNFKTFGGIGSCWIGNTPDEFVVHAESTAETKAEAKVLRKILRLNVVAAEETTDRNVSEIVKRYKEQTIGDESEGLINSIQIKCITTMCKRHGIDLEKFLNKGTQKYNDVKKVPYNVAIDMVKELNKYQSTNGIEIPKEIMK